MLNKDITYNYLIGKSYNDFPNNFDVDNRIDPDTCKGIMDKETREKTGKKLYDDLKDCFFTEPHIKTENREQHDIYDKGSFFYTIFVNDSEFRLSSDYIGPSIYWAKELGIKDDKIIDFLKIARTLGGHILWPRGKQPTVNQAKAGSSGFYDRIDWTLLAIKIFYEIIKNENETSFISKCKELLPLQVSDYKQFKDKFKKIYDALKSHKLWFEKLETFNTFCDFYKLKGSFVDEQYNVIVLAPLFPILPQNYEKYIEENIKAIVNRNSNL